jgi:hypothetical protein
MPVSPVNPAALTKAERLAAKKIAAQLARDFEEALGICDQDLRKYGQIWERVLFASSAELEILEAMIAAVPLSGHTVQPAIEGYASTDPDYYATMDIEFEDLDPTIFLAAKALAKRLGLDFHEGPAKKIQRVMEKARLAYNGDLAQLKDYRRASIICPDIAAVIRSVAPML